MHAAGESHAGGHEQALPLPALLLAQRLLEPLLETRLPLFQGALQRPGVVGLDNGSHNL